MGDYDAVLLTTQNQPYIDAFVKEFGEDCIFTDRPRFEDFNDWRGVGKDTYELTDEKYQKEVEDCLLDVILTSKSDHILGTCSNMFLGALSMNTKNTCELIQEQFWERNDLSFNRADGVQTEGIGAVAQCQIHTYSLSKLLGVKFAVQSLRICSTIRSMILKKTFVRM